MAKSASKYRKRRRAQIFIGIGIGVVLLVIAMYPEYKTFLHDTWLLHNVSAGQYDPLDWNYLLKGVVGPDKKSLIIPTLVKNEDGKNVMAEGFLLPLHTGTESNEFYIAPKPRGCYFCYPPGPSEVIKFAIAGGEKIRQTDYRVYVYGKFVAGAENEGVMYKINDAFVTLWRR